MSKDSQKQQLGASAGSKPKQDLKKDKEAAKNGKPRKDVDKHL